jgi:hypothetical protein
MQVRLAALAALLVALEPASLLALPDLTGTVEVEKGPIQNGLVLVNYTVTVQNVGDASCAKSVYIDFWADYPALCCEPLLQPELCPDLKGSEAFESSELPPLTPGGQPVTLPLENNPKEIYPSADEMHCACLYVDSILNFCPEANEKNNFVCTEYVVPPEVLFPDLTIFEAFAEVDQENPSGTLFTALIKNNGMEATKADVLVEFHLDKDPTLESCADYQNLNGSAYGTLPAGLAPGAVSEPILGLALDVEPGVHLPVAIVNPWGQVEETDLSNNCCFNTDECFGSTTYVHPEVADKPDLVFEVEPPCKAYTSGSTPVFEGVIRNEGFVEIPPGTPFKLGIWYNAPGGPPLATCPDVEAGEGKVEVFSDGLPIGGEWSFKYGGPHFDNGYYDVWLVADCDEEIFEMDEKNNKCNSGLMVEAEGPDLWVKDFVAPQKVGDATEVMYSVWIENKGTKATTKPFYIDVFYDAPKAPTLATAGDYQGPLPAEVELPLEPGAWVQQDFTWEKAPPGDYLSWAVVDIDGSIPDDTNRSNNSKSYALHVEEIQPGQPNLTIEEFYVKVNGTTATFVIVVANTGDKKLDKPFRTDLFTDNEAPPVCGDQGDFQLLVEESLEPGAKVEWMVEWKDLPDGEYKAYLMVDGQCVIDETTEGDNLAGPLFVVICSQCNQCSEGEYLTQACFCGEETVQGGFCCDGQWFAVGCPVAGEASAEGAEVEDIGANVAELGPSFSNRDGGCACSTAPNRPWERLWEGSRRARPGSEPALGGLDPRLGLPAAPLLLIGLLAFLLLLARFTRPRRPESSSL